MDKTDHKPLISIGITCYNAADTIQRAIKSALEQSWDNIEIIIVDDCSTDRSIDVIKKSLTNINNARLIEHEKNLGPAGARQTLLDNANGEFIAFFDDDDESSPNRVQTQYERIISYEKTTGASLIACYASGKRVYPNGYELELNAIGSKQVIPAGSSVADYLLFYKRNKGWFYGTGTPSCALMLRKNTLIEAGGFDTTLRRVEDVDFAIRLALKEGHFIGCSENLFTQHATQASDKSYKNNKDAEVQLALKYEDYLKSVKHFEYAKRWPLIRYYHFEKKYAQMLLCLCSLFIRAPIKVTKHLLSTGPKRLLHERRVFKSAESNP